MAKCKDCIHNEVCDQSSRMMWATMEGKTECDDFKDLSRYVVREKGEWEPVLDERGEQREEEIFASVWRCPACGEEEFYGNFCPNCGADMTGGDRNV